MSFFSKLFSNSEEQRKAENFALYMAKKRGLVIRLVEKRLETTEGTTETTINFLRQLSDEDIGALPEASIVTMTALYRKALNEGATNHKELNEGALHQVALTIVNMTRTLPIHWDDVSQFDSLGDYVFARMQVELVAADERFPILRYMTREHIEYCIQQTKLTVQETLGY